MGKPTNAMRRGNRGGRVGNARNGGKPVGVGKNKNQGGGGKKTKAEITVHQLITLLMGKCDLKQLGDRIKKVNNFHKNDKPHTYEAFGLKLFVNKDGPKVNGELENKRPDLRVVEVSLSGEEANALSYDIPIHPIQKLLPEEQEIVKESLISLETLNEVIEFAKSEKINTETKEIALPEDITEPNQIKLRDVIQLLAGIHTSVFIDAKKIKIRKFQIGRDKRQQSWLWPKRYVRFVLQRNMRFPNVLEKAARRMGINNHAIFQRTHLECGVGYTHQFIQVEKMEPELIREGFEKESCNVSNFEFSDAPIEKNKFRGHKFKVSIRKYKNNEAETKQMMDNFANNGYINYFNVIPSILGRASITDVGKALIKNDCMAAAKLIIRPRPVDRSPYEELKELTFICQDARLVGPVIKQQVNMKDNSGILAKLFQTMLKDSQGKIGPKNVDSAFEKSNPHQVTEYTDLFFHYIWNETVNMLIEKRGLKLAVGDLVFVDEGKEQEILFENPHSATVPKDTIKEGRESLKLAVKPLTQADLDSGEYSIQDLVIPVCGWDVTFPTNDLGGYIDEILKKQGIENKEWFAEKQKDLKSPLSVTFPGTYRKVIGLPESLKWNIREYLQDKIPLILDDVPRNTRKRDQAKANGENKDAEMKDATEVKEEEKKEEEKKEEGKKEDAKKEEEKILEPQNALVLEFFVPRGTSLMTPLRELFKKNDFGALANPFYERLVEQKRIEAFKKKLQQLHVSLMERSRRFVPPFGGPSPFDMMMPGPPMGGGRFGPSGPMAPAMHHQSMRPPQNQIPDQALHRIKVLEEELAMMRNERNQLRQVGSGGSRDRDLDSFGSGGFGSGGRSAGSAATNIRDHAPFERRARFDEDRFDRAGGNAVRFDQDIFEPPARNNSSSGGQATFGRAGNEPFDRTPRSMFNDNFSEQPLKRLRPDFGRNDDDSPFQSSAFDNNQYGAGGTGGYGGGMKNLPSLFDAGNTGGGYGGGNRAQQSGGGAGPNNGFGNLLNRPAYLHLSGSVNRGRANNNQRGRFGGNRRK